ncbi:helix-turn-helix domain-containing protein [Streptomyces sp. NPDC126510]|uniref:TetR/AcrR family transcriptional regulator n=1 Tax=Streptomyces sp. NPDC126510 TaxID=3155317 RepID=UPI003333815F
MRARTQERRDTVVRAAVAEFAKGGLHGTPTAAIALRAGVSQPYLFRLFPGKRELFTAATVRAFECSAEVYARAARGLSGTAALEAMALSRGVLLGGSGVLLMRLQAVMAVAIEGSEAVRTLGSVGGPGSLGDSASSGDSGTGAAFASVVRGCWAGLWDVVRDRSGAPPSALDAFFANESLAAVRASLEARDHPVDHAQDGCRDPATQLKG